MNDFSLPQAGAAHEKLSPFAGTFTAQVKMWMGPGEPMISTGKMVNSWDLNQLFLRQEYSGDASDGPFPNFAGRGWWGYNDTDKRYEGFWIDTASTGFQLEYGHVDETGKQWEMLGEMSNPSGGGKVRKRTVIKLLDDDHHSMEMFFQIGDEDETKTMEIQYVRA